MSDRQLDLMLTVEGGLELRLIADESLVWSSDNDEDLLEAFPGQEIFEADDLYDVAGYLVECGLITEAEAEQLEYSERLDDIEAPANWDDDDAPHRQLDAEEE